MPEVTNYTALLSGASASSAPGTPTVITFSFPDSLASYVTAAHGTAGAHTFQQLNSEFQELVREGLGLISASNGLRFLEVAPGMGAMEWRIMDLSQFGPLPGAAAFANYPGADDYRYLSAHELVRSDVFIDNDRTNSIYIVLHEGLHAVGLKHDFEGSITLVRELDSLTYTLLGNGGTPSAGQRDIGIFDKEALQYLYGPKTRAGATYGDAGNNDISGGSGNDDIESGNGHDNVFGGEGSDTLSGGSGNDHLFGRSATAGADGYDLIMAGDGSDYLQGNAGDDILAGEGGSDRINGGADNDHAYGGEGNDTINGNRGNDQVFGERGNDLLRGGQDNDSLNGGEGNDLLFGDMGRDTLVGGSGVDIFHFSGLSSLISSGVDRVQDFADGMDFVSLGFAPAAILRGAEQSSPSSAATAAQQLFDATAGSQEVAAFSIGSDTYLFYASNGGNTADSAIQFVGITSSSITVTDFV